MPAPILPEHAPRHCQFGENDERHEGTRRGKILVADDQPGVLSALELLLKLDGFQCVTAESPSEILAAIGRGQFDLLLMDLNFARDTTSGREGLEMLEALQRIPGAPPVVVMTAWGSVELAVEAMRKGARDFLLKPWDNRRVIEVVREQAAAGAAMPSSEAAMASQVQRRLLPQNLPCLATLELAAAFHPAGAVSGDYYDFIPLEEGRIAIVLADVAGKGMPAALLTAGLQATLRTLSRGVERDVPRMIAAVNREFYESTSGGSFATLFFGVYDDNERLLNYVNCGHQPPVLLRRDGTAERLPPTVTVLGLFRDVKCQSAQVSIGPGESLVIFSDGLTEAENREGQDFGDERLIELLRNDAGQPPSAISATLSSALQRFAPRPWRDDVTIIAARGI